MKTDLSPDLSGRNVLVTGQPDAMALHVARALGEAGARLMLSGPDAGALELLAADLQACNVDTRWCVADCTQPASVARLCREMLQRMGEIHVLLNCGLPATPQADLRCYELPSREVVAASMRAHGRGSIINLLTLTTAEALSAPHPLAGLTHTLAGEWASCPVRVTTMCHQVPTREAGASPESLQALAALGLELAAGAPTQRSATWRVVTEGMAHTPGNLP